jgi:hypothetical protein
MSTKQWDGIPTNYKFYLLHLFAFSDFYIVKTYSQIVSWALFVTMCMVAS